MSGKSLNAKFTSTKRIAVDGVVKAQYKIFAAMHARQRNRKKATKEKTNGR
jgi:hypothetical protein